MTARRASSPRPKRRGRIEGMRRGAAVYSATPVLHGRNAVAALKAATQPTPCNRPRVLHGRNAVAALKADHTGVGVAVLDLVLHGRNAVAALKAEHAARGPGDEHRSPRPKRRGRIEGTRSPRPSAPGRSRSPRPKRRGRIEGRLAAISVSTGTQVLHGRNAVAALKAELRAWYPNPRAGSPRPKRRGRIEGPCSTAATAGPSCVLHGRNAVAALKGCPRSWPRPGRRRFSTAETPWPH